MKKEDFTKCRQIVIGKQEFRQLIQGKAVSPNDWNNEKIEVILSDIGFQKMKQIIIEEGRKHFSGATTVVKKSPTNISDKDNFATNFAKRVIKNIESKKGILKSRQVGGLCEETAKELFRLNERIKNITKAVSGSIELHF